MIAVLSIILVTILAADELFFYFFVFTPHSALSTARSNDMVAQNLANYLETKPKDIQVVFLGFPNMGYYSIPSIQYLVPEIKGIDINQPWSQADKHSITSNHLLFVFLPNNVEQIPPIRADYPGGVLKSIPALDGELLYETYEIATSH